MQHLCMTPAVTTATPMMSKAIEPNRRGRRLRWDLSLAAATASIPYLALLSLPEGNLAILHLSLVGCVIASLVGTWILRSLARYPGVEAIAAVLSAFSVTYAILLIFFVMGRFEYSRIQLGLSYFLVVACNYYLALRDARRLKLRVGVLIHGNQQLPAPMRQVDWVPLRDPDVADLRLDAVAVDLRADLPDAWDRALADFALAGLPVFHTKHLIESLTGRLELEHLSENNFGTLSPLSAYMSLKHLADWIAACVVGVLLSPVLALIGLAIRLETRGPALFVQERMGYRGRTFRVFKFRTMIHGSSDGDMRTAAMTGDGDKRVTGIGRFLRRTRIDELPQIMNVLRGEMSWIGPRPEALVLSRWYEQEIAFYRYRHIVRPGITGWAQVSQGHVVSVNEVTSKLHYDFYYIKNFGPWLDILIIARTIGTVLSGIGAR